MSFCDLAWPEASPHVVCFPDNGTESDADDVFGPKPVILSACYDFHLDNELEFDFGWGVGSPTPASKLSSFV